MRRIVLPLLLFCFLLHGCGSQDEHSETHGNTLSQFISGISLGITPQQLLEQFSQFNMQVDMPDDTENPLPEEIPDAIQDGRIYNMTDFSFYYKVKDYDLSFTFSYEGYLVSVSCQDKKVPSPKGLFVGDNLDTVKKLYGNHYAENLEGYPVWQYEIHGGYFAVFYENGTVTGWNIQKYPNINND